MPSDGYIVWKLLINKEHSSQSYGRLVTLQQEDEGALMMSWNFFLAIIAGSIGGAALIV